MNPSTAASAVLFSISSRIAASTSPSCSRSRSSAACAAERSGPVPWMARRTVWCKKLALTSGASRCTSGSALLMIDPRMLTGPPHPPGLVEILPDHSNTDAWLGCSGRLGDNHHMPVEPPPTPWVFPDLAAPDADLDFPDDLVGRGADLAPSTLLEAYRCVFPMPESRTSSVMSWWSPVDRAVLPVRSLRISRSLAWSRRQFEIRVDTAFDEVVAHCADPARPGGWIDRDVAAAYSALHRLGWAHSVESGARADWSAGCTASPSAGCSRGSRCSTTCLMPRRWRWSPSSS